MKIIITGCNGQLGSSFLKISEKYKNKYYFFDKKKLDITKKNQVEKIVKKIRPNFFINCSAYTDVTKAEKNKLISWQVNSLSLKHISNICKIYNCTLIHFSTDYVFNGNKRKPYLETDKTLPISVYGKTKLGGEKEILNSGVNYIIIRVSWLYNPFFKKNIINKLIQNIKTKNHFFAVTDEVSKPTCSINLAKNILKIISIKNNKLKNIKSIFHYSDAGNSLSIYELSKFIKNNSKFNQYQPLIKPIKSIEFNTNPIRPNYSALSNRAFINKFVVTSNKWRNLLNINIKDFY